MAGEPGGCLCDIGGGLCDGGGPLTPQLSPSSFKYGAATGPPVGPTCEFCQQRHQVGAYPPCCPLCALPQR